MLKRFFVVASLLLVPLFVIEAGAKNIKGSGNVVTEEKTLENNGIENINIAISGEVEVISGETLSVKVSAYENHQEHIKIDVQNGTLRIYTDKNNTLVNDKNSFVISMPSRLVKVNNTGSANITVNVPAADDLSVELTGSGRVVIPELSNNSLAVNSTGSGRVVVEGNTTRVSVKLTGSGRFVMKGRANSLNAVMTGSGLIDCENLNVSDVEINKNGSGMVRIAVDGYIRGQGVGSGKIFYKGDPQIDGTFGETLVRM